MIKSPLAARKAISLFLSIVLFTGTITSFYTLSFIQYAQALSVNKVLEDIDCDNININGNDISIDTLPQSLGNLADLIKAEAGDSGVTNSEQKAIENYIYKCINNNENQFIPPQVEGTALSINKDWFVCNNDSIDCVIEPQGEDEQTNFEGPNSGNYTQCTSDGQCPFVNNADFSIKINGNNPTPNTIPAEVNTEQQVEIGTGSYTVTEELLSDRFVPNGIFDVENIPVGELGIFLFLPKPLTFDQVGQSIYSQWR